MSTFANRFRRNDGARPALRRSAAAKGDAPPAEFVDRRAAASSHAALQEMANTSHRSHQLQAFQTIADTKSQLPVQLKAAIEGPVPYKKGLDNDVAMSEIRVDNSFMWSFGFAPCVALCAYGETEGGEKKMAFWHVDATQGDGEQVVARIISELGEDIKEESVTVAAVQGKDQSSQFDEIAMLENGGVYPVHATAVPSEPELANKDEWWDVEVYMHPDEKVEFSTPTERDYHKDD